MTTQPMGTKLQDQMLLELARKILQSPTHQHERAERQIAEFLVRYLKGEIGFLKAKSELQEDFPVEFD